MRNVNQKDLYCRLRCMLANSRAKSSFYLQEDIQKKINEDDFYTCSLFGRKLFVAQKALTVGCICIPKNKGNLTGVSALGQKGRKVGCPCISLPNSNAPCVDILNDLATNEPMATLQLRAIYRDDSMRSLPLINVTKKMYNIWKNGTH